MRDKFLSIPSELWRRTWTRLRAHGDGQREAACIWAGDSSDHEERVTDVIFLDDLPGVEAFALQHRTTRKATGALFAMLHDKKLSIIADVHTHPQDWVDLSWIDKAHPIEYRPGLTAIVLPNYAVGVPSLETVGIHIYLGDGQWRQLDREQAKSKVRVL